VIARVVQKIREAIHRRIRSVRIGAQDVIQASWVETVLFFITRIARVIVTFLAVYFYLGYILGQFIWTWSIAQKLLSLVVNPLKTLGNEFVDQLPNLFFMLVLIALARYVIKLTKFFFEEIGKGTVALPNFHPDWARPTYKMVRTLIILLSAVIIYP